MLPTEKPKIKDLKNKKGKTNNTPTIDKPKTQIIKAKPKVNNRLFHSYL